MCFPSYADQGQAQEIALSLARPQRKQQRQMQMCGRLLEKSGFVLDRPDRIYTRGVVEAPSPLARIDCDAVTILSNGKNPRQHGPRIVRLADRLQRELVTPIFEHATRLSRSESLDRESSEFLLNQRNLLDVIGCPSPQKD